MRWEVKVNSPDADGESISYFIVWCLFKCFGIFLIHCFYYNFEFKSYNHGMALKSIYVYFLYFFVFLLQIKITATWRYKILKIKT